MLVSPKAKQLDESSELLGTSATVESDHPVLVLLWQRVADLRWGKRHRLVRIALVEELQCGQRTQVLQFKRNHIFHSHAKRQLYNVNHEIMRIKREVVDLRLRLKLCHNRLLNARAIYA